MVLPDPNSVKIYTVNGAPAGSSSSLPDWLTRKRAVKAKGKRAIREHVEGSIELIQHFEFPEASNKVKTTRDGKHVIATGTYKPQMRVWDLGQLSLKFERHSDAENVDFEVCFFFLARYVVYFFALCVILSTGCTSGHDLLHPLKASTIHINILNPPFKPRSSPTTGQKRYTSNPTAPSNCTPKAACTTKRAYPASAAH